MWERFNSKTNGFMSAALLVASFTAISGLLGLLRDRLLASRLGASALLDVYFAAFRIPDLVYYVLIAGGVGAVFLPLFSQSVKEKKSLNFTNNFLTCLFAILIFIYIFTFLFAPILINFITPGFSPAQKGETTALTRIILLNPVLFGISAVFSGVLHHHQKFLAYCLAPVLYNLGIIFGILFLLPIFGLKGIAFGVIGGALLHLFVQYFPVRNSGFRFFPVFDFNSHFIKNAFGLMIPRMANQAANQLNLLFINAVASSLVAGSISVFNLSNNLSSLPVGIVGTSFAIASFPFFSKKLALGLKESFLRDFSLALRQTIFLILPVSSLLFVVRVQLVRLILGAGQFGWWGTRLTAASLGIFAFALLAASLIPLFLRAFFSLQDTKSPLIAGVAAVFLNIVLSFLFVHLFSFENAFSGFFSSALRLEGIGDFRVIALPLALLFSQTTQVFILFTLFIKEFTFFDLKKILNSFEKTLLASVNMAVFAFLGLKLVSPFFITRTGIGLFLQTLFSVIIGLLAFVLTAHFLLSEELEMIIQGLKKRCPARNYFNFLKKS